MFRNSFQHRFVTVFSSSGSKPLAIWDVHTKNGHSRRVTDEAVRSLTFELIGVNVATTYMVAPCCPCPSLCIKLPFLVMLVKNLKKFFSFEVQILDDKQLLRRLRFSNYQSCTRVDNFSTSMPLSMTPGWNQVQLNMAELIRRAYGTNYVETVRIKIHANVRIKRIYFCDRLYTNDETPGELRLYPPIRPNRLEQFKEQQKKQAKIPHEPIETVRPTTPVEDFSTYSTPQDVLAPAQCVVETTT
ncbi:cilia- and flagella-associated protein 20-like [Anopheles nili]|uniref:cilia- and flagella-associated protein 20-like n=1 Tax=Anopheles nili TaxID=185578 RepID=UPI00237A4B5C|nr:cilia- and flagella-associated protein 20-like [Anopheles nili]